MDVQLLSSDRELEVVAPVLLQLRPQFQFDSLITQVKKQQKNGYQIVYVTDDDAVVCVVGFVTGHKLAWGKYIYIDDLVTDENHRSTGAGKLLIDWFKDYALYNNFDQLHLDSGVQRFGAHKFYLKEDFIIASHHFSCSF
ncbi:GNAT family N-acetyltransferase [Photobacterium sp. SDRW27]|uniref:GNAT family N-acetyltransferase n=1 Tax=Photobacterium obscurum TaxID=2829490 RepID=UPI00224456F7|nr:GNAT family N-acetyltransferase [Photobacterium obscurum]MCW8328992.1 GNAT family N-acetyltransferase [Photobacterium obscurum]